MVRGLWGRAVHSCVLEHAGYASARLGTALTPKYKEKLDEHIAPHRRLTTLLVGEGLQLLRTKIVLASASSVNPLTARALTALGIDKADAHKLLDAPSIDACCLHTLHKLIKSRHEENSCAQQSSTPGVPLTGSLRAGAPVMAPTPSLVLQERRYAACTSSCQLSVCGKPASLL